MKTKELPLSGGLDFYKLTMGQVIYERHPNAEVTFTLKNRDTERPLSKYVSPEALQQRLDHIREHGFTPEEIAYYGGLAAQNGDARFTADYLNYLSDLQLPVVNISIDPQTEDLAIDSRGKWIDVTFWETVIMSEINEVYYRNLIDSVPEDRFGYGITTAHSWEDGDEKLNQKIEKLRAHPGVKFADFGTRRRFSASWHEHVIQRLAKELPDQFVGTSNPWFAYKYNLAPVGTFAHEMPMVYAGIADAHGDNPLDGHNSMLRNWQGAYGTDLSTALTDTFGSEFFFNDFTPEQARDWSGLRHDSGDPIEFGERAIDFYEKNEIDPTTKTIVFSDGLDVDTIIRLYEHFEGRIKVLFGWGTSLMNDLGWRANNMVMKATHVKVPFIQSEAGLTYVTDPDYDLTGDNIVWIEKDLVKLSDNEGKHTGPQEYVDRYVTLTKVVNEAARRAVTETVVVA